MFVGEQDLPSIHLIRLSLPMDHTEAFGDLALVIHLLIVLYQVARAFVFALNLVHLHDLVRVLVLLHLIQKGSLTNGQVILELLVLITVLALA